MSKEITDLEEQLSNLGARTIRGNIHTNQVGKTNRQHTKNR